MLTTTEVETPSADQELRGRRPHLDGLRTVAVYLVLAFHAGADRAAGGFVGVDVFFVLSGFLVTRVLLDALPNAGEGGLGRFYARRVRRLLPASTATIIATALAFSLVSTTAEMRDLLFSFRATLLYVANWHFIAESSNYFADDVDSNPLLHFWSLAIEEQFYFVWPLLLLGLLRLAGWTGIGLRLVRFAVAGFGVASLIWAFHLAETNVSRAYYGTDSRSYQLLAGALLALTPSLFSRLRGTRWANILSVAGIAGVLGLATNLIDVGPITRGAWVTLATVAVLVGVETSTGGVRAALSFEPMTYLGQISYGTYLAHWPIIIILGRLIELPPLSVFAIAALLATSVAALSSHVLESPIRRSPWLDRFNWPVVAVGLTSSVVVALALMPTLTDSGQGRPRPVGEVAVAAATSEMPDIATIDWEAAQDDKAPPTDCNKSSLEDCYLHEGAGRHITLVGDSHAVMFNPLLEALGEAEDLTVSSVADFGCSWPRGLAYEYQEVTARKECYQLQASWYDEIIPALDPDIIILVMRAPDDPRSPVPIATQQGFSASDASEIGKSVVDLATDTVEGLLAEGRTVVVIDSIPRGRLSEDVIDCLSSAGSVAECAFAVTAEPLTHERALHTMADTEPNMFIVDLDREICPRFPTCDAVIDGLVTRWDSSHLTTKFAASLTRRVQEQLEVQSILGGQ